MLSGQLLVELVVVDFCVWVNANVAEEAVSFVNFPHSFHTNSLKTQNLKIVPGCVETVCYGSSVGASYACTDEYKGGDYPVPCGVSVNCAPGFRRIRCCPQRYA